MCAPNASVAASSASAISRTNPSNLPFIDRLLAGHIPLRNASQRPVDSTSFLRLFRGPSAQSRKGQPQMERIVIVGAGQSGAQAVASLRAEGFAGMIQMLGDEAYAPYQRPPLSKAYLSGAMERERLFLKPDSFYREAQCELMLGVPATRIDRITKRVTLSNGVDLAYDKLLLATGSRVRRCTIPGCELPGIFYLRGIADVDAMRAHFAAGTRLAVVGGGYIGLEVAAVARKLGLEVTVFEALDRVMARAVSNPISEFYERSHRDSGVRFHLNTPVEAFEGGGRLEAIRAGGQRYEADLALVGIGIVPNMELARETGLACND